MDDETAPMHPYWYSYEQYVDFFLQTGRSEAEARRLADGEYNEERYQAAVKRWEDYHARRLLSW